ncbi:MAG: transcriptional repressor [Bacteroidales bacterium]|nr:transcriptional repressor [Candidatus Colicola coprequi]
MHTIENDIYSHSLALYEQYVVQHRLRHTPERIAVLELACTHGSGFFADELCKELQSRFISKATVYNTLSLFAEAGILFCLRNQTDSKRIRYEFVAENKHHIQIICPQCGRLAEIKDQMMIDAVMAKAIPNFVSDHISLYIYGHCKKCRRPIKKKK